jgi:hypothetical protein
MLFQLLLGGALISCTIIVQVLFITAASLGLKRVGPWLAIGDHSIKLTFALTAVTLWMLGALGVGVGIWAVAIVLLGVFQDLETSMYFASATFTTLGYGDVTLPREWRLLSGFIAANGLVLFSLSTAFIIEAMRRLREAQVSKD